MQISRTLFNQMVHLFATNNALLGLTDPNQIRIQPANQNFTPGLDRVLADVPVQGAPLHTAFVAVANLLQPIEFTDPLANERIAEFAVDAIQNAFYGDAGTYPFTIYGTRLVSQDGATLLATQLLDIPVPFNAAGQGFDAPRIQFKFPVGMVR